MNEILIINFMKQIFSFLLLLCAIPAVAQMEKKPNIIFILADDLGYGDTEPYGQQIIKTPHLNKLAEEGMKFTQFYAGASVCAPSRASIITGETTGVTHIRGNKEVSEPIDGQAPIPENSRSIGKILKSAGYNTAIFGKWGLGTVASTGNPLLHGFDTFFGYNSQLRAHRRFPPFLWQDNERYYLTENGNYEHQIVYSEDVIHEKALDYLEKQSSEKPFFAMLAYTLPHAELVVPQDSILESYSHLPEKPYKGIDYNGEKTIIGGYMSQPKAHATHAAMVSRLDKYLGDVRKLLKRKNLDDNTIIIFASDNGAHFEGGADPDFFKSSGILRGLKRDLYEGGIRTPFIVYWKGKVKQQTTSNFVGAFWDLMPTFADIAGVPYTKTGSEVSILPTLLGKDKKQKQHKYLYWEFHELGGRQAVRYGKWKGVRLNVNKDKNGSIELYDLEKDPSEKNNIAKNHPRIVKKIAKMMEQAHQRSALFPFAWEK
ncbi:arylsulfatase [Capnocytophaga canis]|nr:arylsulfatase [Capnocytophaga canis]